MPSLSRRLLALGFGAILVACSAADGANTGDNSHPGPTRDGATGDGTAAGDGAGSLLDGSPNGDGGGTTPDGQFPGGDGAVTGGDGAVPGGDGTVTGGDGAVPPGDGAVTGDGGPVATGCGPREICGNGLDDNCNGTADEGCPCLPGMMERCYAGAPRQAGVGVCVYGMQRCEGTGEFGNWGACMGSGQPQPVQCGMHMDYRCDGTVDEGCGCPVGNTRACYSGEMGTLNVGVCHAGMQTCVVLPGGSDWGPCTGDVTPTPNVCDGMDRMCNGNPMSGCVCIRGTTRTCYDGPAGTSGVGVCHGGRQTCGAATDGSGGTAWGSCTGEVVPSPNMCDGIDRMCNGMPAAGCSCTAGMTQPCYTGPAATRHVGICHDGTQACDVSAGHSMWSTTCAGQAGPAAAEVCGNGLDDNCNGVVDEGCGGTLTCPADQTVLAGQPITLNTMGGGLHNYAWTIVTAPTGGASTVVWSPSAPTAASETFTPFIVGVYTLRVTAQDAAGHTVTCMFNVTALPHGLRVQLTWNGSGDLDLHLHNGTTNAWFNANDCYYANRAPGWGAALDFDNTVSNGPENTRVNVPTIGMPYTIAVHNYARGAGRIATVQVFCGSTTGTTPTATYTSRSLNGGNEGPDCTSNDFWRVARVVFTSPTACTLTVIDTYTASNNACSGF